MTFLASIIVLVCAPAALLDYVVPKWTVDKNIRIEDAYKHLYQATRGVEHATGNRASAEKWLEGEWRIMGSLQKGEALWEPLCKEGEIGRLNLRPFNARGGDIVHLLTAFLASAGEYKGEPQEFTNVWAELGRRLKKKKIGKLDFKGWDRLDGEMRKKNYPPIHHSDIYNKTKKPAYRILTREQFQLLVN
jgi:hypothetical protein